MQFVYFKKYLKLSILLFYVLSLALILYSLNCRMIHIDDAWLGEYAYWLSKNGVVKSEFFRGFENYEIQLLVYHKLFILLGAKVISWFGFNVFYLKSISLIFFVLSNIILYWITKKLNFSFFESFLGLLLFSVHPLIFEMSFVYRPEIMVMTIGLVSYLFLHYHFENPGLWYVVLSGLFAGLCTFTHLNGLIYIAAGGILLLINKQVKHALLFGLASLATSALYFYDIFISNNWELFFQQFKNDPALSNEDFTWYNPIINILKEHERFFHSPTEIFFSVVAIFSVLSAYKQLLRNHKNLFQYTMLLIISLAILAHGKTAKYLVYCHPFLCVLTVISIIWHFEERKFHKRFLLPTNIAFCLLYFLHSFYYNLNSINRTDFVTINKQIAKKIPLGSDVIAPMRFIYNEIFNYRIMSFEKYEIIAEKKNLTNKNLNIFDEARKDNIQYIIFSAPQYDKFVINEFQIKDTIGYKFLCQVDQFKIFKTTFPIGNNK